MGTRKLIAVDCETDPFLNQRVPVPFIWGAYDGKRYRIWHDTDEFVHWLKRQNCYAYAHNGGKFDFMFLMKYLKSTKAKVIAGRIAEVSLGRCKLRDSYSIMPVAMKQVQKGEIDYWKLEKSVRNDNMPEIEEYLRKDVYYLYQLVKTFRETAGTQITIASNSFKYCRKLKINPGKTNWRFDREFRDYYFGGRTECFKPGTHENIKIIDIVSSYPYAMLQPHPTGDDRITWREKATEKLNELIAAGEAGPTFIHLRGYSKGAFPRKTESGALEFPHAIGEYKITGWEYLVAKKHGLIKGEEIISLTAFKKYIDFTPYIKHWFEYKASWDKKENPVEYEIGKRMMNAAYGKLAQDPTRYYDYEFHPSGTPIKKKEGWQLYTENFMGVEVHRRSSMWRFEKKYGKDWRKRNDVGDMMQEKELRPPKFFNVATGASITGFSRAHLLDTMHSVGAENTIYCDTDSLMLLSCDLSAVNMGKELGQWELEGEGEIGHFAGKKTYAIRMKERDKTGEYVYKIASKGCKITYDHMQAEINSARGYKDRDEYDNALGFDRARRLVEGETIEIINPSPSFSLANGVRFVPRLIRATSRVDTTDRKE